MEKLNIGLNQYTINYTNSLSSEKRTGEIDVIKKVIKLRPSLKTNKFLHDWTLKHEIAHAIIWEYTHNSTFYCDEALTSAFADIIKQEDIDKWES